MGAQSEMEYRPGDQLYGDTAAWAVDGRIDRDRRGLIAQQPVRDEKHGVSIGRYWYALLHK